MNVLRMTLAFLAAALYAFASLGCGESMSDGAGSPGHWDDNGDPSGYADASAGGGTGGGVDIYEPPPIEEEEEFQPPSVGDRYIFVLNSARDQLVLVDAETLEIRLVEVGIRPTIVATAPGEDVAVVINMGGGDLTVVHAGANAAEGDRTRQVGAAFGVNRLAVAPDGRHAVAWFSYEAREDGEPVGSLQSVTVVRLDEDDVQAQEIGTGFHPTGVTFTDDGQAAWVTSEEGLTRIPLDGDLPELGVLPTVPLTDDPLENALEREVLVAPDGERAVVRTLGRAELVVVRLSDGALTRVPLPGEPTDVDLTPSGDAILVMLPQQNQAALTTFAALEQDEPDLGLVDLAELQLGAAVIAPEGGSALLYTTAGAVEAVIRLDLDDRSQRAILLQKTVRAVAYGPLGRRALVLHRATPSDGTGGEPDDLAAYVDAAEGFSVVDIDTDNARLQLTGNPPDTFAFTPAGEQLHVLLPAGLAVGAAGGAESGELPAGSHGVAAVDLDTLMTDIRALPSPPESVLPVPRAGKVAVSQEHRTGRITFFDIETGESDTITGYQLSGLIQ